VNHQENLTAYIAAFIAELVKTGVVDVVISPGSRSTPMAMLMAEHPDLRIHMHMDERSAAFFALGIAKASRKPVAILCTSGTAAANYYPAIIEANISRIPLIVLTADRPHELRDVGAPQAIDQIHLYGKYVKWFVEMAPPENTEAMIHYARTVCARAAATALRSPAGPVHLNFPFREPLVPDLEKPDLFDLPVRTNGYVTIEPGVITLPEAKYQELASELSYFQKGLIICGPQDEEFFAEAVIGFAQALNFPILADPLSQLRSGKHSKDFIIDAYDSFLRSEDCKKVLKPDVIIRFGAMPVSKALTIFIKENKDIPHYVIDRGAGWRDPALAASHMIYCHEGEFCRSISKQILEKRTSAYFQTWMDINKLTKAQLAKINDLEELSEGKLFYQLGELIPEGATLFVGNSMPIRDLDTFFHVNEKSIRVMANRGANGIDGIVSTALGAASVTGPLYLVLGDLTFYHDLNGLLAAKLYELDIKILLINNNGGGIFSFLPQASQPKHFELLFGTPVDLNFSHVVKMYGGTFDTISSWDQFTSSFLKNREYHGLSVMEMPTGRERNVVEHRELWNLVSREISQLVDES
jgi:2-succinyl-5-enolpyruvyl-6-hydroxy-3-cyclohexene-1-carboxylate synthase